MEFLLYITLFIFSLSVLFEKMSIFIEKLKKSKKQSSYGKNVKVEFKISTSDKKEKKRRARLNGQTNSKKTD